MTSVIVPVFNGAHVLSVTLPALQTLAGVHEVLVVDDGSQDGTPDLLGAAGGIRVVTLPQNRGRAAARNVGVAEAAGDVLVFLDADVEPPPRAAAALAQAASRDGAVAAVARLDPVLDCPVEPFQDYVGHSRRGPSTDTPPGGRLDWRFFLSGVCAVRREVFDAAGRFPEAVRYGEDQVLACRLSEIAPDGLRLADATIRLHDLGDLDRALGHAAQFGAAAALVEGCEDGPFRLLESAAWARPFAGAGAALLSATVRRLPVGPFRRRAVRYLLATTALAAVRRA